MSPVAVFKGTDRKTPNTNKYFDIFSSSSCVALTFRCRHAIPSLEFRIAWVTNVKYFIILKDNTTELYYGVCQYVKVRLFIYRPGEAPNFPGCWSSQISRWSAHVGVKLVSPTHRPYLLPRKHSWHLFLLEAESPRAIVWPEGLSQWKVLICAYNNLSWALKSHNVAHLGLLLLSDATVTWTLKSVTLNDTEFQKLGTTTELQTQA
jgi:hypothetical protein